VETAPPIEKRKEAALMLVTVKSKNKRNSGAALGVFRN
jgi:hypothetical protein